MNDLGAEIFYLARKRIAHAALGQTFAHRARKPLTAFVRGITRIVTQNIRRANLGHKADDEIYGKDARRE